MTEEKKNYGTNVEYTGTVWMSKSNMGSIRLRGKDQNDEEYSSYVNFMVSKKADLGLDIADEKGAPFYVSLKGFMVPNVYTDRDGNEVKSVRLMVTEMETFGEEDRPKYKNEVTQVGYTNNVKTYGENLVTGYSPVSSKNADGETIRAGISVTFAKDARDQVMGMQLEDGASLKTEVKGFLAASKPYNGKAGAANFVVTEASQIEVAESYDNSKSEAPAKKAAPKKAAPKKAAPVVEDDLENEDFPF